MTNQDKKEFLKRYLVADRRLTVLIDELEIWRSRVTKITPFLSGLPGGSAGDHRRYSGVHPHPGRRQGGLRFGSRVEQRDSRHLPRQTAEPAGPAQEYLYWRA